MEIPDELFVLALLACGVVVALSSVRKNEDGYREITFSVFRWRYLALVAVFFVLGKYNVLRIGSPLTSHAWFQSLAARWTP